MSCACQETAFSLKPPTPDFYRGALGVSLGASTAWQISLPFLYRFFIGVFVALQKHRERCSRFHFLFTSFVSFPRSELPLGFWQEAAFVAAYNTQSPAGGQGVPGHLVPGGSRGGRAAPCALHGGRMLLWCLFVDAETIFRDRVGFFFPQIPVPELVFRCFSFSNSSCRDWEALAQGVSLPALLLSLFRAV